MTVATIVTKVIHGPTGTPVYSDIEAPEILHFNRQDDELTGSPVVIGANLSAYSNYKSLILNVNVGGTTSIANLRAMLMAAATAGLAVFALTTSPSSYTQCSGTAGSTGNRPADSATALAASPAPNTPASHSVVPVSPSVFTYDSGSYATSATGPIGKVLQLVCGQSSAYAGGAGAGVGLPDIAILYDEA